MIQEKEVLFGIIHRGNQSELIINHDDPKLPQILMGALSFLAATDEAFFADLKGVIQNVEENGDKIREMVARHQTSGLMRILKPKTGGMPN
ncbi:MAG: hypothetical protein IJK99_09135 [Bacteroidales bacterium]|nr:hypothetical protein [Bacteroidales bacterium]